MNWCIKIFYFFSGDSIIICHSRLTLCNPCSCISVRQKMIIHTCSVYYSMFYLCAKFLNTLRSRTILFVDKPRSHNSIVCYNRPPLRIHRISSSWLRERTCGIQDNKSIVSIFLARSLSVVMHPQSCFVSRYKQLIINTSFVYKIALYIYEVVHRPLALQSSQESYPI